MRARGRRGRVHEKYITKIRVLRCATEKGSKRAYNFSDISCFAPAREIVIHIDFIVDR